MIATHLSDQTVLAVLFCLAQVTLFAAMGTIVTRWLIPNRPQIAATIACTSIGVIVLLTLAIPFSVPRWLVVERHVDRSTTVGQDTSSHVRRGPAMTPGNSPGDLAEGGVLIDVPGLMKRVRTRVNADRKSRQLVSGIDVAIAILGIGALLGFIRFAMSIAATRSLTRGSAGVNDGRADRILADLCAKTGERRSIELLESSHLSSAAVAGHFRPRILLPADWIEWSDEELSSVLAHELAHVAGRDFAWRAIGAVAGSLHFCNPFVHQLIRSMVLAQELSADIVAATTVERRVYIRSLSVLALRRDQSDVGCPRVGIAPVFSGYLIRRIKMLRSKEDLGATRVSTRHRLAVTTMVVTCGLVAFTMRGYAEPPTGDTSPATEADETSVTRIARASQPKVLRTATDGLFQRPSVGSADVADNRTGMFEIRLAEILRHNDFATLVSIANSGLAGEFKAYLELDEAPSLDLKAVEVIFGSAQVTVRQADEKGKSVLMFGSGLVNVRFSDQVDAESWTEKHVAGASRKRVEGETFLEIPEVPMLGPASVLIANRDPQTFCIGSLFRMIDDDDELATETRAREFVQRVNRLPQPNASTWASAFDQAKGGLFTVAFTKEDFRIPDEFEPGENMTEAEEKARRVFHRIQHALETVAIGVDMNDEGTCFGIRVHVSAADDARLESLAADIRELVNQARQNLDASLLDDDQEVADPKQRALAFGIYEQLLDRMAIERLDTKDGSSSIAIHSSIEHPSLAGLVTSFVLAGSQQE